MMGLSGPHIIDERYAIYDEIASGGMATVHFGCSLGAASFSRIVAIKRLHAHLAREMSMKALDGDDAREACGAERAAEMHGRHAARCDLVVDRITLVDDVGTGQAHHTNLSTREAKSQQED